MTTKAPSAAIQAILDRTAHLAKRDEENFIELGRLLRSLQDESSSLFRAGYEKAEIGKRSAYGYAQIARAFDGLPVTDEELAAIGATRALLVSPYIDANNCGELVDLAKTLSVRDLRITMEGGDPVPSSKAILLYLAPEDHARFIAAILKHGGIAKGAAIYQKEKALMKMLDVIEGATK